MNYTSTEISELTGYNLSQVSSYLRAAGFTPVGVAGKNQNIWDEECLHYLTRKKHNMEIKNTIVLTTLSASFNSSSDYIRNVLFEKGIEPVEITKNSLTGNKVERYPYEVKEILTEHFENLKEDNADEHPLVTDRRCLRLNWFPDTIPNCFEDLDEDIA